MLSPGKANVGIIPAEIFAEGKIGLVSRSGTLTYQIGHELAQLGLGNSTIVGIGGDPVVGSSFIDVLEKFEADPETEYVVLVGEIGGNEEEKAASFIEERMTKPVFAYIAGFSAPPGKTMGHAGAIISGTSGTAQAKKDALEAAGIAVGTTPTEVAQLVAERVGSAGVISFSRGVPAPECLPVEELAECARAALLADGRTILSYGSPSGYEPLREWIAERHGVEPDRVFVTNGGLQGFVFFAQRSRRRGDARARRAADVRPAAQDPARARRGDRRRWRWTRRGSHPDALEAALAEGPKPAFLYTIPTFQNPSGRTLSHRTPSPDRRDRGASTTCSCSRTIRTGSSASRASREPSLLELEGATASSTPRRSRRRWRPASASATSSCPPPCAPSSRRHLLPPTSRPACRPGNGLRVHPSRQLRVEPRAGAWPPPRPPRRDARRARRRARRDGRDLVAAEGGYFVWLDVPGRTRVELLGRSTDAGVTFVAGHRLRRRCRRPARLAYSFVSPDEIREGVPSLAALLPSAAAL